MNDTVRGAIVFAAALVTIALWVPLRNHPERMADGAIVSETYFGAFTYGTLRTELREPDYNMSWRLNYGRLALTALMTAGLWGGVVAILRKTRSARSAADRAETE